MIIDFNKKFYKRYEKLPIKFQQKIDLALDVFAKNPLDPVLRNHALHGSLHNARAIWVTGDIRIIFREYEHYYFVLMLDVGTHNQVY